MDPPVEPEKPNLYVDGVPGGAGTGPSTVWKPLPKSICTVIVGDAPGEITRWTVRFAFASVVPASTPGSVEVGRFGSDAGLVVLRR